VGDRNYSTEQTKKSTLREHHTKVEKEGKTQKKDPETGGGASRNATVQTRKKTAYGKAAKGDGTCRGGPVRGVNCPKSSGADHNRKDGATISRRGGGRCDERGGDLIANLRKKTSPSMKNKEGGKIQENREAFRKGRKWAEGKKTACQEFLGRAPSS